MTSDPFRKMKKVKVLFAALVAASIVSVVAFVNNVVAIVQWWGSFFDSKRNTSLMSPARGFIDCLDWTVVDYSAVTTFIPMLGFLFLTRAAGGIIAGKRTTADEFPFFKGSDQLNIALGLFGTLWGIIVIGFYDLDTVSMGDLMQCLHTALFSTLTAVVWVFMIDRPILRPYFVKLLQSAGLAETSDGDIAQAVDCFIARLEKASEEFDNQQKAYQASFEARQQAYADDFEKRLSDYEKAFEMRQKEYTEFFLRRIAQLEKTAQEERLKAQQLNAKLSAVVQALHQ